MAYSTISKPSLHFNTKLYTGTGSSLALTGVGFQPDFTWIKCRAAGSGTDHVLFDAVRGVTKALNSNDNSVEDTISNSLTAFGTDGFTVNGNGATGASGDTYVGWNWKANGAGSSNTDGSINSTVSANTTAGFSIVSYTGTGSLATIGHGLGVAPKVVIVKRYSAAADWVYYTTAIDGSLDYLFLNTTAAKADTSVSVPTSTVFSKSDTNNETQIAYCFAEKKGFSKFGSYTGNGNADGTFVYTGFKPAFVIFKVTNDNDNWHMHDNKRTTNGGNPLNKVLYPNLNNLEGSVDIDFLSNGFKPRSNNNAFNASGKPYIYMAFAEEPLVANVGQSIPATAR
jgi:hypothetical protein